jgi:carbon-monoxide dehydrogenase medium subunit
VSISSATEVRRVASLNDAVAQLRTLGTHGAPLAGGTWIMRSWMRREAHKAVYVALDGITELHGHSTGGGFVELGALVTHAQLARLAGVPATQGLRRAAALSAFPAVRNVATLGGNVAARGFAEADLIPPLLASEAELELAGPDGLRFVPVESYVHNPAAYPPGEVIVRVRVPTPARRRSAFARLTVRGGGEYALASVAVCADLDADGVVTRSGVAIGSVEERPRLCPAAAAELEGRPLGRDATEAAGVVLAQECDPRDGLDAPAWYRREILPALLRRTVEDLTTGMSE